MDDIFFAQAIFLGSDVTRFKQKSALFLNLKSNVFWSQVMIFFVTKLRFWARPKRVHVWDTSKNNLYVKSIKSGVHAYARVWSTRFRMPFAYTLFTKSIKTSTHARARVFRPHLHTNCSWRCPKHARVLAPICARLFAMFFERISQKKWSRNQQKPSAMCMGNAQQKRMHLGAMNGGAQFKYHHYIDNKCTPFCALCLAVAVATCILDAVAL